MERPHKQCYWVKPNRFLAGEYPGHRDHRKSLSKISTLLDSGISYFIDLTELHELVPYERVLHDEAGRRRIPVVYQRLPIRDVNVPTSWEEMVRILDVIDLALEGGQNVYVHCWGGVGRTGTVVGCYLVSHGLSGNEALKRIDSWWKSVAKSSRIKQSPETVEQMEYVLSWRNEI